MRYGMYSWVQRETYGLMLVTALLYSKLFHVGVRLSYNGTWLYLWIGIQEWFNTNHKNDYDINLGELKFEILC